jgi:hypothetical protein
MDIKKIIYYGAISLMIPTFIIVIFYKDKYPSLAMGLAVGGIALLALITFVDFGKGKRNN